jgi:hypothetical protein
MGLIDRLRDLLGGSGTAAPTSDVNEATDPLDHDVDKELAVERVQHDVASARESAVERAIDEPGSFDDRR